MRWRGRDKRAREEQRKLEHEAIVKQWAREVANETVGELFADLERTSPGRAALRLGAAPGAHRRPCLTHGLTGCDDCNERIGRYMLLHRYGAAVDTITCMFVWDDDDGRCPSGYYQHLCGVDGADELGAEAPITGA